MERDQAPAGGFVEGSVKTYGKAVRLMSETWMRMHGTEMQIQSVFPSDRFVEALGLFEERLKSAGQTDVGLAKELAKAAGSDGQVAELFGDSFPGGSPAAPPSDIDDVSPNAFKAAAIEEAKHRVAQSRSDKPINVELDDFLRGAVTRLLKKLGWSRRINVGANRHFPRMLQWLRELEQDYTWDDGQSLKLMNRARRGRVAQNALDPRLLLVRIDGDCL